MNIVQCKGCGRKIFYARNPETNKLVPLEARSGGVYKLTTQVDEAEPECELQPEFYINHFRSCPQAKRF